MCRPFWLCQSRWHAEQLLIRRQVWQSLAPLHQTGSTSSPKQSTRGEAGEGGERQMAAANERGERKQEREEGWRESESEKRDGSEGAVQHERGQGSEGWREETCRRISLGSGAGLFNEQVHSTPPSSVAPAGWRPPGSGSAVGAPACSISGEHRGELRMDIYFLSLPVEQPAHLHRHIQQPRKHSLRISHTCTHTALGEERGLQHALSLSFFPPFFSHQRYNWVCLTHKHSGNKPGFPLMSSGEAHSCARWWEKSQTQRVPASL